IREIRLHTLSGNVYHVGLTHLGPRAVPFGRVVVSVGNGYVTEVALEGRVVCTYLHGPVLALNPALADLILSWFVGELEPLDDSEITDLREERRQYVAAEQARRSVRRWRRYRRRRMSSTARPRAANFSV